MKNKTTHINSKLNDIEAGPFSDNAQECRHRALIIAMTAERFGVYAGKDAENSKYTYEGLINSLIELRACIDQKNFEYSQIGDDQEKENFVNEHRQIFVNRITELMEAESQSEILENAREKTLGDHYRHACKGARKILNSDVWLPAIGLSLATVGPFVSCTHQNEPEMEQSQPTAEQREDIRDILNFE